MGWSTVCSSRPLPVNSSTYRPDTTPSMASLQRKITQHGGQDGVIKIALLTGAHDKCGYVHACALLGSPHTAPVWPCDRLMVQPLPPPPDSCRCIDQTRTRNAPFSIMASGQLNNKAQVHATDMQPHVSCSRLMQRTFH
jgi:hypothetical protein